MGSHTVDDVYTEVVEVKKKLEQQGNGGGASKDYIDKKFKEAKEDPTQEENWTKAMGFGLDELVKSFKDFKGSSVAAWSALGAVITGFVVSNFINSEKVKEKLLDAAGFKHDDNGIPRSKKKLEARAAAAQQPPAPRAPVTSIDTERLKSMRKASIELARSLNDLTKDVTSAARAIA
ncbi:hypothetical protein [Streptomyces sp. NPDC051286]|uniref:hypothetical protein n=1 Tax=Streptomyces sp. NPDC051286 TaxID=3365647 RepID=UPI0037AB8AE5